MKPKKFNFISLALATPPKEAEPTASYNKNGQLVISPTAVRKYGFGDKLVAFVYDKENKALGFRLTDQRIAHDALAKDMRILRVRKEGESNKGAVFVSVGRLLKPFGVGGENYKGMPVQKYVDVMNRCEVYYMIMTNKSTGDETK